MSRGERPVGRTLLPVGRPSGGGCGEGLPGDQCRHTSTPSAHTPLTQLTRDCTFACLVSQTGCPLKASTCICTRRESATADWLLCVLMDLIHHVENMQISRASCCKLDIANRPKRRWLHPCAAALARHQCVRFWGQGAKGHS